MHGRILDLETESILIESLCVRRWRNMILGLSSVHRGVLRTRTDDAKRDVAAGLSS